MKCPKCRKENPADAKFCNECAAPLNPEIQTSSTAPFREAERKRITALFSDLSGYTAMTTKLDPEEVKEITSRIFDGTRAIIKKYEAARGHYVARRCSNGCGMPLKQCSGCMQRTGCSGPQTPIRP